MATSCTGIRSGTNLAAGRTVQHARGDAFEVREYISYFLPVAVSEETTETFRLGNNTKILCFSMHKCNTAFELTVAVFAGVQYWVMKRYKGYRDL